MERIKPSLFLNYARQIGKPWRKDIRGHDNSADISMSAVRAFFEALIPAAGDGKDSGKVLAAISNAIYIEARRHNMSLSSFGHLDPVKFAIAILFPALFMGEIKRDLGITCHYEFGNLNFGRDLLAVAGFDITDTIENFPAIAVKYNRLVARLNNLMIPEIPLFKKWLKHRTTVFKDDEGDRYSLYLYNMSNFYELDVDATSGTAGQLLCKFREEVIPTRSSISDALDYIDRILTSYEGDDDMVTFATEAIKAGMGHLVLDPIPSTAEAFSKVELPLLYELDDVLSLENARFVTPLKISATGLGIAERAVNWNIMEVDGQFQIGQVMDPQGSGKLVGRLPVAIVHAGFSDQYNPSFKIENSPILTHAKITSDAGLEALTRYMCSATLYTTPLGAWASLTGASVKAYQANEVQTLVSDELNHSVYVLDTFNTEMLTGGVFIRAGLETKEIIPIQMNFIAQWRGENTMLDLIRYFYSTIGFKARFAVYFHDIEQTDEEIPVISDYDYLTSVTEDSIQNFFAVNAWNYCII